MPLQQAAHDAVAVQPAASQTFASEALAPSESQLSPVITGFTAQQKAHVVQPIAAAQTGAKVKRQDDVWTGKFTGTFIPFKQMGKIV